jgi:ribosomal protein L37E
MLDLNKMFNVSLEIKHAEFPLYFKHRNVCIHCGAEESLVFIDKFGKESTKEIAPFDHIRCKRCGRIYSMKWEPDEKDHSIYRPSAVEFDIKRDLKNMMNANVRHRGDKAFEEE